MTSNHTIRTPRREGSVMSARRSTTYILATVAALGITAGAIAADAAPFRDRAYEAGHTQDLTTDTPPVWPAVADTCTTDCTVDLVAAAISVPVKDAVAGNVNVPALGFGVNGQTPGLAGSVGSIIKVPQGTTVTVHFDDSAVAGGVSLSFPSLASVDDQGGGTYVVHADKVGTSVFQPGDNADAPRQIAMGLVGVLIVTPVDGTTQCSDCAYDPSTHFDEEAVVATTDLDLDFATTYPAHYDMSYVGQARDAAGDHRRVYHVINGKSFPDTDVIDTRPGHHVLLRYVNAGLHDTSMGALGLRQDLLARNTSSYSVAQSVVAPVIGPGETADVSVTIPATAAAGQKYSLLDQGDRMGHGEQGFGGALTFIDVWGGEPPAPAAPAETTTTTSTTVATFAAPTVTIDLYDQPSGHLTASATVDPALTVTAWETQVTPTGSAPVDGSWTSEAVGPSLDTTVLASSGQTVWVRVTDSNAATAVTGTDIP